MRMDPIFSLFLHEREKMQLFCIILQPGIMVQLMIPDYYDPRHDDATQFIHYQIYGSLKKSQSQRPSVTGTESG